MQTALETCADRKLRVPSPDMDSIGINGSVSYGGSCLVLGTSKFDSRHGLQLLQPTTIAHLQAKTFSVMGTSICVVPSQSINTAKAG